MALINRHSTDWKVPGLTGFAARSAPIVVVLAMAIVTVGLQCVGSGHVSLYAVNEVVDTYHRKAKFSHIVISAVKVDAVVNVNL